jgi:hypothetical protein
MELINTRHMRMSVFYENTGTSERGVLFWEHVRPEKTAQHKGKQTMSPTNQLESRTIQPRADPGSAGLLGLGRSSCLRMRRPAGLLGWADPPGFPENAQAKHRSNILTAWARASRSTCVQNQHPDRGGNKHQRRNSPTKSPLVAGDWQGNLVRRFPRGIAATTAFPNGRRTARPEPYRVGAAIARHGGYCGESPGESPHQPLHKVNRQARRLVGVFGPVAR